MQPQRAIIFFDGLCHLCNGFVDSIIKRDQKGQFQFAPFQGETAAKILPSEERAHLESVILLVGNIKYYRSDAILKILCRLGGIYRLCALGYLLPTFVRDMLYAWVAKNRYAWFGHREFCRVPEPQEKERLLP